MLRKVRLRFLASGTLMMLSMALMAAAPLPLADTPDEGFWFPGATMFLMPFPLGPDFEDAPAPDADGANQASAPDFTVGACCLDRNVCAVVRPDKCDQLGGVFRGLGTTCLGACPTEEELGACCIPAFPAPICLETSKEFCILQLGGIWQGKTTRCATTDCPRIFPF